MDANTRNKKAKAYVTRQIEKAKNSREEKYASIQKYQAISEVLDNLIRTKPMGFRGITLTAIVGLKIDPDFDPISNFYSCHPRSIFEKGIYYALTENNIPCGKSDPLNVAKNNSELSLAWAKGKRPESAALAVVSFLEHLMEAKAQRRKKLIDFFFYRLVQYAEEIESLPVILPTNADCSNLQAAQKLIAFSLDYPEGGATPQLVVGKLLARLYDASSILVDGENESVFGTNTTSKKPADIWLSKNDELLSLYEVTVKKVDHKRLTDCYETLVTMGYIDRPITFICRIPHDVTEFTDAAIDRSLLFRGKRFDFVDIGDFIRTVSSLISPEQMDDLISELHAFVKDVKRSVPTKNGWNSIFQ